MGLSNSFLMATTIVFIATAFYSLSLLIPDKVLSFELKTQRKKILLASIILIVLFIVAGIIGPKLGYLPSDEEWEEIYLGREMVRSDDFQLEHRIRHGFFYPTTVVIGDVIYGKTHSPASMNALFVLLCMIAVYLATMAVTGKRWIALVGMFFLFLNPRWLSVAFVFSGFPVMLTFSFAGFVLFWALYIRTRKLENLIGMISFSGIMAATKIEYGALFIVIILALFLLWEKEGYRKALIPAIYSLLAILPAIFLIGRMRHSSDHGFCGVLSQVNEISDTITKIVNSPIIYPFERMINAVGGWRFSLSYFIGDLGRIYEFWTSNGMIIVSIMAIIGLAVLAIKKDRVLLAVAIPFVIMTATYAADCATYESRYGIPQIVSVAILAAVAISTGFSFSQEKGEKNKIKGRRLEMALFLVILLTFVLYFPGIRKSIEMKSFWKNDFHTIKMTDLLAKIPESADMILVIHYDEMMEVMASSEKGIRAESLSSIFVRSMTLEVDSICDNELDLCRRGVYFIRTPRCVFWDFMMELCDMAAESGEEIFKDGDYAIYEMNGE